VTPPSPQHMLDRLLHSCVLFLGVINLEASPKTTAINTPADEAPEAPHRYPPTDTRTRHRWGISGAHRGLAMSAVTRPWATDRRAIYGLGTSSDSENLGTATQRGELDANTRPLSSDRSTRWKAPAREVPPSSD